jgi:hypothetical protein
MYLVYDTPVWSLVMIWSTPSSRKAQVVARSAVAGGIEYWAMRKERRLGESEEGRVVVAVERKSRTLRRAH